MEIIEVSLKSWAKYNYRPDVKKASWFRLDHSVFEDPDLFDLDAPEMAAFIYVLCQASRKSSEAVRINLSHSTQIARIPRAKMLSAITKLQSAGVLTRYVDVTPNPADDRVRALQDRQTYKTDNTNNIGQNKFDLESLYFLYPRKIKKKKGIEKLRLLIKSQEDFDLIKKAVSNYSNYCSTNVTESKFIMHFTTFVSEWQDWVEPKTEFKKLQKVDIDAILRGSA